MISDELSMNCDDELCDELWWIDECRQRGREG